MGIKLLAMFRKILLAVTLAATPAFAQSLTPVGQIELPNVVGRIDHFAYDSRRNRLWVAGLENHSVEILDLNKKRRVAEIPDLTEPQGLTYAPGEDFMFVASRGDGTLRSFDAQTFRPGPWVDLGRNSDNVRYDAATQTLYVGSNGEPGAGTLSAIDLKAMLPGNKGGVAASPRSPADLNLSAPRQADWRARVELDSHPESFQIDGDTVYINIPDEHVVGVIKSSGETMEMTAKFPVSVAQKNFAMALDAPNNRLFVVSRKPALLLVYDTQSGALLSQTPCVGDCDDVFYDATTRKLILIGGEEGALDVFDAAPAQQPRRVQRLVVGAHARTGYYIASQKLFAVAVPKTGKQSARVLLFRVN